MKCDRFQLEVAAKEPLDERTKAEARKRCDLKNRPGSIHVSWLKADMIFTLFPQVWRKLHRDHRFFEIANLYFHWLNGADDDRQQMIDAKKTAIVRVVWLDDREDPDFRCPHTVIFEFRYAGVCLEGITVWDTVLMKKIEFTVRRS